MEANLPSRPPMTVKLPQRQYQKFLQEAASDKQKIADLEAQLADAAADVVVRQTKLTHANARRDAAGSDDPTLTPELDPKLYWAYAEKCLALEAANARTQRLVDAVGRVRVIDNEGNVYHNSAAIREAQALAAEIKAEKEGGEFNPPVDPLDAYVLVTVEKSPRCHWHDNCDAKPNRQGIMKPVKKLPDKIILECLNCGVRGHFPVGHPFGTYRSPVEQHAEQHRRTD